MPEHEITNKKDSKQKFKNHNKQPAIVVRCRRVIMQREQSDCQCQCQVTSLSLISEWQSQCHILHPVLSN